MWTGGSQRWAAGPGGDGRRPLAGVQAAGGSWLSGVLCPYYDKYPSVYVELTTAHQALGGAFPLAK